MKILLVEDHMDVANSTMMLLELLNHDAHHACNGDSALAIASMDVNLVLIDIGLPDMTGFELAMKMRNINGYKDVIMVALTGFDCREKALASGFDHHFTKPMNMSNLNSLVAN